MSATKLPTNDDIAWAKKYGWVWDGSAFVLESPVKVIPNPMSYERSGWTPWLPAIGALQMDAGGHADVGIGSIPLAGHSGTVSRRKECDEDSINAGATK